MQFKSKLRKIGNSWGVIVPKNVITSNKLGDIITLNVITLEDKAKQNVITSKPQAKLTNINNPDDVKNWANKLDNKSKFKTYFKK